MKAASIQTRGRRKGFTLLEILLVLALLGLLSGLFISIAGGFTSGKRIAEDVFWEAVGEGRKQALLAGRDVTMTFAAATKEEPAALVLNLDGVQQRKSFESEDDVKVDFLSTEKARSSILVGGQLVETQTLPAVTFYGDGTCSPFRAQFRNKGINPRILAIDPWTCAQMLTQPEGVR